MEEQDRINKTFELYMSVPSDQIFLFDNFIPNDICKSIIKEIDKVAIIDENDENPGTNVKCKTMSDDVRDNLESFKYICQKLYHIGNMMFQKYAIFIKGCSKPEYRKIYGSTRIHVDGVSSTSSDLDTKKRVLSAIIALNEDYEGGEIVFPVQNRKIKLKMGQVILFPPYWTHPHYTNNLKNNTFRYTINTWFYEN